MSFLKKEGKTAMGRLERTDHVLPEIRSQVMRAVKSKGARSTERRLRALLVAHGFKGWRMHADDLPGKPDFIFRAQRLAIFVDGCFWHACPEHYRRLNSSQAYWDAKVQRNMRRDATNRAALRRAGWRVLRLWENELAGNLERNEFNVSR